MSYSQNIYKETVIATNGTINNLVAYTSYIRFTGSGSISLTGINAIPFEGGAPLIIKNETGGPINLLHQSASSSAANRLFINASMTAEDSIPIPDGYSALFYYSEAEALWMMDVKDFNPAFIGKASAVVESVGDGTTQTVETVEIELVDVSIVAAQTAANLNTLYPNAVTNFKVHCPNIAGGALTYICYDEVNKLWASIPLTLVS